MKTRTLIVDDHPVVIEGFKALLAAQDDIEVVGTASEGAAALALAAELLPDVLVCDLMMPGIGGLEVVRRLPRHAPRARSVVISMHSNEGYVAEALRSGATAYVLKQAPPTALLEAIRAAYAGRRYVSPPLTLARVAEFEQRMADRPTLDPFEMITNREREVLQLAAQGLTSRQIATALGVGRRTVETHRMNLMQKLGLGSHAELVKLAIKKGLIE